jgi:hypothetical protein
MDTKTLILQVFLISTLLAMMGCVGTVKKLDEDVTKSKNYSDFGIVFEGIDDAVAVAHNKVDISFFPAGGGSGIFTYVVYRDGNFNTPVASIPGIAANVDAEGKFHIRVGNLLSGTNYTFAVRCFDLINDVEDINTKTLLVDTLDYEVPIFDGIIALENVGGADGETKLKVRWNTALPSSPSSDPFGANPNAISGYTIYLGTSPENMAIVGSVTDPALKQFVVTNLTPGTNYFARVRAKNSVNPAQEDLNIKYIQKSTLLSQPILFNGLKTLTIPSSNLGYSRANLTWTQGSGSFDRYRIFVSTNAVAAFDPAVTSSPLPDITDLTSTSYTISTGLSANTTHYIAVVACKGSACTEYAGHNIVKNVKTTPPVATFNGINSIVQPNDSSGLSSLILNWSEPDTSLGVYNEMRVFLVDSATGFYNPSVDQVPSYDDASPEVPGYDAGASTTTSTVIKGLQTGTEYCFIVKAYATSPFDPSNPNGRTHTNEKKMCGTPVYSSPGFSGIKSICSAITASGFTVSWDTPNPMGIFDRYNIWLKPSNATSFDFNNAIAGDPAYILKLATKDKVSLNITGLSPNTTYKIGARTYFYNPVNSSEIYDENIVVATCATSPAKVEHNGWFEITSVGRKMDGRATPPTPILERMSPPNATYSHTYPQEYPFGSAGVDASDQGIIRIAWEDFTLTGGLGRIYDYPGATNGYRVYRKVYDPTHEMIPPSVTDSDWGAAINPTLIVPKITNVNGVVKYFAEFNDYTVTRPADPTETKIYWYKVEAVLNNSPIAYNSLPPDGVIKVILPPDNMSFVHRWMANKDVCAKMGLPILRGDNYKCAFNGFTSVGGYFDMEHGLLVNRFELGCKYTRGNDAKKCTSADVNFEGKTNDPAKGIMAGDCIGNHSLNPIVVSAARDAILYRRNGVCYINNSATYGTSWIEIRSLEAATTANSNSPLPKYNAVQYPSGTGKGAEYASEDAKLPGLTQIYRNNAYHTCAAFEVKHKGTTYPKRFLRRKEFVAAASWSSSAAAVFKDIEAGVTETGSLDRDCNTTSKGSPQSVLDLNDNRHSFSSGGASMITGSGGDYSTEACVSRYGIQDMVGNYTEMTSEPASGQIQLGEYFSGTKFKDIAESQPADEYWVLDTEGLETLRTGTGQYLNFANGNIGIGNYSNGSTVAGNYFSVPLGIQLKCGQDDVGSFYCDNRTDDNTLVTAKSSFAPATVTGFNYGSDYTYMWWRGTINLGWLAGGNWGSGTYAGQYYYELYNLTETAISTSWSVRCGTLLLND